MSLDRNALDRLRLRRNSQRERAGDGTTDIKVTAPIQNSGGKIILNLLSTGGLTVSGTALSLKLADTSLVLSAPGVGVNLRTNSGLQISSGLGLLLADTSLQLASGGVSVLRDPAGAISVSASGIAAAVDGTTMQITSNKLAVKTIGASQMGILTTKGDILGYDTAPNRVPIGSDGQVLTADSTKALGLKWAAASGGVNSITAGDNSITIGGTGANPTVAVNNDPNGGTVTGSAGLKTQLVYVNTADSTTLTNVTTFQNFSLVKTLPANFFTAGKTIRITNKGTITVNAAQQVAVSINLAAFNLQCPNYILAGAATVDFELETIVICRSTGVSGSFMVKMRAIFMTDGASFTASQTALNGSTATLNTTGTIDVRAAFAATVANNSAVENIQMIEVWG